MVVKLENFASASVLLGAIVEDVRTVFERKNDATIYIPTFDLVT